MLRAMETVIWVVQAVLAFAMLGAGGLKLTKDHDTLKADPNMAWTQDFSAGQVKGIGALEVLAAIGLVLPAALDGLPVLTAVAAVGVVLLMIGAARTHLGRGERQAVPVNVVLLLLAAFVAVERFGPHSL